MNTLLEYPEIVDPPEVDAAPPDLKTEWLNHFAKAVCSSEGLARLNVPPREPILGEWFRQGDLGFIYGSRGLGKTWLAEDSSAHQGGRNAHHSPPGRGFIIA